MSHVTLTFDLMTPKSDGYNGFLGYIQVPSLIEIWHSVLEILQLQANLAYILCPATFDLWPHDPKI